MERKIPKIVHYCWFGEKEKPKDIRNYMETWKEKMSQYQFIEWNENNFDIDTAPIYVKEAYAAKKYAFVSDYVRIKVLYDDGGVYFDTDIEVLKNFDQILEGRQLVLGFESDRMLETAFIACCKQHPMLGEFLESYDKRRFILRDGTYDMSVINEHFSKLAEKWGVDLDKEEYQALNGNQIVVYPREYFAAFDIKNCHIKPTSNSYTVHHMNASWGTLKKKLYFNAIHILQMILGYDGYDKLKFVYDGLKKK